MATEVVVRKWGNSLGIILPYDVVEKERIHEEDKIIVQIVKRANLSDIFGSLPRTMSGQEFKDLVRKGWKS